MAPATAAVQRGESQEAVEVFGKAVLGPKRFAQLSPERMEQVRQNFIDAEFVGSGFPPIQPQDLRKLAKPTMLLAGDESPAFFHRVIERLVELIPNAHRVVIPEASHLIHEDNEPAFIAETHAFLAEASPIQL
jgi:pimeloyl-ACP methyl ester carboxylesterase